MCQTISLLPGANAATVADFDHLDGDELWRRGRAVGAVVNGRLYLVLLDAARSHYFAAALPEFENVASTARLRA